MHRWLSWFNKLSLLNKIGTMGSVASLIGLFIAFDFDRSGNGLPPSPKSNSENTVTITIEGTGNTVNHLSYQQESNDPIFRGKKQITLSDWDATVVNDKCVTVILDVVTARFEKILDRKYYIKKDDGNKTAIVVDPDAASHGERTRGLVDPDRRR